MRMFRTLLGIALVVNFTALMAHNEPRQYFESENILIDGTDIYVALSGDWIKTDVLRTDEQGFYIFGNDLREGGSRVVQTPKSYTCPYCHRPTPIGEECTREDCPRILWKKNKNKES